MRLLDLFCGGGGCSVGYARAGFTVVGVDIAPQPHYPFEFIQADALTFLDQLIADGNPMGFDVIAASPPCQAYSITRHAHNAEHPDLYHDVRARLIATGLPWIIENVPGVPMRDAVTLCGSMFGLTATDRDGSPLALRRHRLFESSHLLFAPGPCQHDERVTVGGVYGGGSRDLTYARTVRKGGYTPAAEVRRELMGIEWMPQDRLSQAIPPAYTEHLGRQMFAHLGQP